MTPDDARAAAERVCPDIEKGDTYHSEDCKTVARALLDQAETQAKVGEWAHAAADAGLAFKAERDDLARQVEAIRALIGEAESLILRSVPLSALRAALAPSTPPATEPAPCGQGMAGLGGTALLCGLPSGHRPPHVDRATGASWASWEVRPTMTAGEFAAYAERLKAMDRDQLADEMERHGFPAPGVYRRKRWWRP